MLTDKTRSCYYMSTNLFLIINIYTHIYIYARNSKSIPFTATNLVPPNWNLNDGPTVSFLLAFVGNLDGEATVLVEVRPDSGNVEGG